MRQNDGLSVGDIGLDALSAEAQVTPVERDRLRIVCLSGLAVEFGLRLGLGGGPDALLDLSGVRLGRLVAAEEPTLAFLGNLAVVPLDRARNDVVHRDIDCRHLDGVVELVDLGDLDALDADLGRLLARGVRGNLLAPEADLPPVERRDPVVGRKLVERHLVRRLVHASRRGSRRGSRRPPGGLRQLHWLRHGARARKLVVPAEEISVRKRFDSSSTGSCGGAKPIGFRGRSWTVDVRPTYASPWPTLGLPGVSRCGSPGHVVS
jgi:hypothetical protein